MMRITVLLAVLPLASAGTLLAQISPTLIYYSFGQSNYGLYPEAGVIAGRAGEIYGTTSQSGSFTNCYLGCGTVFSAIPPATAGGTWSESPVHAFQGGADGAGPRGLVMNNQGVIYGFTYAGGPGPCGGVPSDPGCGTVFSLTPPTEEGGAWTESVLYSFSGGADGGGPAAAMVIGPGGVLYGTATFGGANNSECQVPLSGVVPGCGTVFSLTAPATPGGAWSFSVIYTFAGFSDGITPGNLAIGAGGVLYGNTVYGGSDNCTYGLTYRGCGTLFSLTPPASGGAWTKTLLYAFQGGTDGSRPDGVVIGNAPGAGGPVLYGVTGWGGNQYGCGRGNDGCGTVFMLSPPAVPGGAWTETILAEFPPARGYRPSGNLAIGPGGVLFGVTAGSENRGFTVYALLPPSPAGGAWKKRVLSDFVCCGPGSPSNVLFHNGRLYGTTYYGGLVNAGTVWALVP